MLLILIMFSYPMIILFTGTFLERLGKGYKFKKLPRILKENYIVERMRDSFANSFFNFIIYFLAIYILLVIIITVDIESQPNAIYFMYIIMLPIALVLFINLGNKDQNEKNFRRIFAYVFIVIIILARSYNDLLELVGEKELNPILNHLNYVTLALFTGLDNLVQAINEDHKNHKEYKRTK